MGSVTLMKNTSDDRCLKKATSTIHTYTCKFKSDCSIMKPELELNYESNVFTANYCYIPEFKRYYYITDITVSQQRIFVKCKVDVLMSYADEIYNMSGYYKRSNKVANTNTYLVDNKYEIQNNRFPAIRNFNRNTFADQGTDDGWILAVASNLYIT